MNEELKISIIIPVYRVEQYVGACIESIQKQTLSAWEIIAVDDCGGDASAEIVEQYAKQDVRIRFIRQEQNMGPMWARKLGIEAAKGEFLFFCDADDWLPDTALETLYAAAKTQQADMVVGQILRVKTDGETSIWNKNRLLYGSDAVAVYQSLLKNEITHNLCGDLFRTSLLQQPDYISYPHMRHGEDALLFYQIVDKIQKACCVELVTYYYRDTPGSSSHVALSQDAIIKILQMRSLLYAMLSKKPQVQPYAFAKTRSVVVEVMCILDKNLWPWYREQVKVHQLDTMLRLPAWGVNDVVAYFREVFMPLYILTPLRWMVRAIRKA